MYNFFINIMFLCNACLFFSGCSLFVNTTNDDNLQQKAIDERLQNVNLGKLQYACDGCDFYMQEAVISKNESINKNGVGGSSGQTGVRVYIFHNVSIQQAFYKLLDSNIFSNNMDKDMKDLLMNAILANKKDFSKQNIIDEIGLYAFSSISYANRLNNTDSYPKAMMDSVNIVQKQDESLHSSNSLEAFIVNKNIVILHFYAENNSWTRY